MSQRAGSITWSATLPASFQQRAHGGELKAAAASEAGAFIDKAKVAPQPYVLVSLRPDSVTAGFDRHCVAEFEHLAKTAPLQLIALATSTLSHDPVYVAQIATALALATTARNGVIDFLLPLLGHPRAFVREAAIMGLSNSIERDRVRDELTRVSRTDSSAGVREAAADVLAQP